MGTVLCAQGRMHARPCANNIQLYPLQTGSPAASAKSAPPAVYMHSGGLSNAPRLLMPHLSDIRPFLRRKRSFPGPGMGLACLNYSRHDTHTKVHIARSTATNRGEGALHLGAEVRIHMHCAISMWIPPLHRTMAHMRRARKRPRRRPQRRASPQTGDPHSPTVDKERCTRRSQSPSPLAAKP